MTDDNDFDTMTERLHAQGLPTDTHPEGSLKHLAGSITLPPYDDTVLLRPVVMDDALIASMYDALDIPQELRGRTAEFSGSGIGMRHAVVVGNRTHSGIEAAIRRALEDHPEILLVDELEDHQLPAKFSVCADDFIIKKGRAIGKSTNTHAAFEGFLENERGFRAAQSARPIVSVGSYRSDKERARAKAAKKSRRKNRK